MAKTGEPLQPAYLDPRRQLRRSAAQLLLLLALVWGAAAVLAYLIISPDLAKDYFSAHRTVKAVSKLVVPGLAVSAGAGFLAALVAGVLLLRSHSRRVLEPLRRIDGLLRGLAEGRVPRPADAATAAEADVQVAAALEPLRARVEELRQVSLDLQKVALELNYRSAGTEQVTLKDFRGLAHRLDVLAKDLARATAWFEG